MPGCYCKGRRRGAPYQGGLRAALASATLSICCLLGACGANSPAETPAAWFHDLEGGQIAAARPPPPGVGLPYPKIGTVPPKPKLPDQAYRTALRDQLMTQRDRTERLANDTPIPAVPPPPKPVKPNQAAAQPAAAASLATADAPPDPPASARSAATPATTPGTAATATPSGAASPPPGTPLAAIQPGTPVVLAGAATDMTGLPPIPDAPPPVATFEGVSPEPPPTPPPPLPQGQPVRLGATSIVFQTGDAQLLASQNEALKGIAGRRGNQTIEITGAGDAASDTPEGQAAAIELALRRAHAVAKGLEAMHVPPASIRLAAYAFGRGATVRLIP